MILPDSNPNFLNYTVVVVFGGGGGGGVFDFGFGLVAAGGRWLLARNTSLEIQLRADISLFVFDVVVDSLHSCSCAC